MMRKGTVASFRSQTHFLLSAPILSSNSGQSVFTIGSSLSAVILSYESALGKHLLHRRMVDTPRGGQIAVLQKRTLEDAPPAFQPQKVRRLSRTARRECSDSLCTRPCSLLFTTSGMSLRSGSVTLRDLSRRAWFSWGVPVCTASSNTTMHTLGLFF